MTQRKMGWWAVGVVLVAGVGFLLTTDVATDLVKDQAKAAVRDMLGGELVLGGVSGNPLRGYTVTEVALNKDEAPLFQADRIALEVSLFALLRGGAVISDVEIVGAQADADRLGKFFSTLKTSEGGGASPVDRVTFVDSVLTTSVGTVEASRVALSLGGPAVGVELDVRWKGPGKTALPLTGKGEFLLQGDALSISGLDLGVGKGRIRLSGAVLPDLAVEGSLEGLDAAEVGALWPETEGAFQGRLSLTLQSGGTWQTPRISGDATLEGGSFSGVVVDKASGRFVFTPEVLKLAGLEASLFGATLRGNLVLGLRNLPPEVNLQMRGSQVDLARMATAFPALGEVQGMVDKISLDLKGSGPALDGRVTFVAPSLRGRGQTLEQVAGDVKIRGGNTLHIAARARGFGAPLTLSGTATLGKRLGLNLEFKGTKLDLARLGALFPDAKALKPSGEINAAVTIKGNPEAPQIAGSVSAPQISLAGETLGKPAVNFALRGTTLVVNSATVAWKGSLFSGSGQVGGLGGKSVTLDLKGKGDPLALDPLAGSFPALKDLALKGAGILSWSAKGSPENLAVGGSLSWKTLRALGSLEARELDLRASGRFAGGKPALEGPLTLQAARLAWAGAGVDRPVVALRAEGNRLVVEKGEGNVAGGALSLAGAVTLPGKPGDGGTIDLQGSLRERGLERLGKELGLPVTLGGKGSVKFAVGGTPEKPSFTLDGEFPSVAAEGISLENATVAVEGTPAEIRLTSAKATVESIPLALSGTFRPGAQGYVMDLTGEGKGLDLASLLRRVPALKGKGVEGVLDVRFALKGAPGALEGSGELSSAQLGALGFRATKLAAPFSVKKNILAAPAIKALFYGGQAALGFRMNLDSMGWELQTTLNDMDLGAMLQAASQAKGTVSGTADVDFKAKGNASKGDFSGKGLFQAREGAVTGYPWVDLLATVYGASGVRYQTLKAPFSVQGTQLTLLEGTKAVPREGDPLYRSLGAAGTVGPNEKLNLAVKGNVNVQVINALMGGVQGGLLGGLVAGGSVQDALKNALKGLTDAGSKQDFRDVSFTLGGTTGSPKVSQLQVGGGAAKDEDVSSPAPEKPAPAPGKTIEVPGGEITLPVPDVLVPDADKPAPGTEEPPPDAEPTAAPKLEDALKDALLDTLFKQN